MRLIDADKLQQELMENIHTESTRILIRAIIAWNRRPKGGRM